MYSVITEHVVYLFWRFYSDSTNISLCWNASACERKVSTLCVFCAEYWFWSSDCLQRWSGWLEHPQCGASGGHSSWLFLAWNTNSDVPIACSTEVVGSGNPPQCGAKVGRATHVILLLFLPHVEGDHGGDAVDAGEEGALLLPQLGKLIEEVEVLRQVLAVWPHPMLNLHTPPTQPFTRCCCCTQATIVWTTPSPTSESIGQNLAGSMTTAYRPWDDDLRRQFRPILRNCDALFCICCLFFILCDPPILFFRPLRLKHTQ